jgi:microsomal dipeptidase-like Zn-dependent dipeptidase
MAFTSKHWRRQLGLRLAGLERSTRPGDVRKIAGENWLRVLGQAKAG